MGSQPNGPIEQRFWRYVERAPDDQCWLWQGSLGSTGYGQLRGNGRTTLKAHRISWQIHRGPIPPGMSVLHHCDSPPCVNPAHLFVGTQTDNMADAARKGRIPGTSSPGSTNPTAKLTEAIVIEARLLNAAGVSFRELARRFAVNRKTITQAIRGERWSHV